ncbi:hypothetical protein [Actinomyces sp. HMT897]|uniref:hypothetical protein n=1 Tax=Actinomyces sp. HMT897 TaxID=2789424 RepID=UPI00190D8405|nr:hypothetical protein [Actinomyces sp. HMT897]QQO78744.1 hypothetical protein JJJ15_05505 [Actinomyces sp. HMT897]
MSDDAIEVADGHQEAPALSTIDFAAEACWAVWCSRDQWIRRKVEQIEYLDRETATHSISYDIDFSHLRSLSSSLEGNKFVQDDRAALLLPLDVLDQRPYMTERLGSPWNGQICLATRHEAAYFKTLLLLSHVAFAGGISKSITKRMPNLNEDTLQFVFDTFLEPPIDTDADTIIQRLDCDAENDRFSRLLTWIQSSTFVIVSIPNDDSIAQATLTYSFSDRMSQSTPPEGKRARFDAFLDRYGIRSFSLTIPKANSDEDLALRLRMLVPPGMRVDDAKAIPITPEIDQIPELKDYFDCVSHRQSGRVVSVYAPPVEPKYVSPNTLDASTYFDLKITMNPKREILAFPALVAAFLSFFIAQLLANHVMGHSMDDSCDSMSSFPTLAPMATLIPAFIGSRVIVSNEHETVSFALGFRRILLTVSAVLSVILSTILAISKADHSSDGTLQVVLFLCVVIEFLIFMFFLLDIIRIEVWRRGTRGKYNRRVWGIISVMTAFVACCFWWNWPLTSPFWKWLGEVPSQITTFLCG